MTLNTNTVRRPLSAGSELDAWCTRCKMDLGHRVVAMVGASPKRVVCQTCGSEHNYRPPKSEAKPAPSPRKAPRAKASEKGKRTTAQANRAREEWERMVKSGKPFRRYSISDTFDAGDLIMHKKFGEGYVVEVVDNDKVTIAFSDGERTLIHGS